MGGEEKKPSLDSSPNFSLYPPLHSISRFLNNKAAFGPAQSNHHPIESLLPGILVLNQITRTPRGKAISKIFLSFHNSLNNFQGGYSLPPSLTTFKKARAPCESGICSWGGIFNRRSLLQQFRFYYLPSPIRGGKKKGEKEPQLSSAMRVHLKNPLSILRR